MTDLPCLTRLSAAQQTEAGLPAPRPFAMADRVRYSEIDALNHANNVAYMTWFEANRTRYFNAYGITPTARTVVRHGEIDWLAEMHFDQLYIATTRCLTFRRSSFTLMQEI